MQTKTKIEELVLKEIREMPETALPQVLKIIRSLRQSLRAAINSREAKPTSSGLCGLWKDDRNAEDIVEDIYSHRTGFGGREIEL